MRSVPLMFLSLVFLGLLSAPAIPAQAQLLEEEDAAWDAFLATLPPSTGDAPITEAVTPVKAASVGIPTMSGAQRRIGVMAVAICALMALLFIPQTRRRLLGRLRGAPAATPDGVSIHVGASKNVGPGQRIVTLEVDGQRLLVGMSPGRMDLLHSWFEVPYVDLPEERSPPRLAAVATIRDDKSPAGAGPSGGDGAARAAAVSVLDSVLRERAQTAGADVGRLVETWRRSDLRPQESKSVESVESVESDPEEPTPWWMEGATEQEMERQQAANEDSDLASMHRPADRTEPEPYRERRASSRFGSQKSTGTNGWRGAARIVLTLMATLLLPSLLGFDLALAAETVVSGLEPAMRFEVAGDAGGSSALRLLATLTLLAVAPALILSMTSFTRIIIVFSLLRQAIGVQQSPPNQVLIGMTLFLTWFIMGPTFERVHEHALSPWMDGEITEGQALETAMVPMREFMFRNTREKDLGLFLRLDRSPRPKTRASVPTRVLVPAFLISELKTAFQIGFLLYVPFLVIDIVVATVLLAMGMMVLPPVVISLPFKLLLFVFVDGWNLLVGSLVNSFA